MKSIKLVASTILLVISAAFSQSKPEAASYLKEAQVSETEGTVHVIANSPRPLQQVLDALHKKYGWAIDYEDPRFTSQQDVVDVADPVTHAPHAQTLPAGGKFTVDFPAVSVAPPAPAPPSQTSAPADSTKSAPASPVSATPVSDEEEKTVRLIVDAYNKSDNPGRFDVRKNSQGNLDVVGTAARDSKDQISPQKPILDTRLTVPRRQRTATETIELLCKKLTTLRGTKVAIGVNPRNLLDHTPVTIGAKKALVRDLLWQTLTAAHCNCYLRVVFDPNSKGFYLSIHSIQVLKRVTKDPA